MDGWLSRGNVCHCLGSLSSSSSCGRMNKMVISQPATAVPRGIVVVWDSSRRGRQTQVRRTSQRGNCIANKEGMTLLLSVGASSGGSQWLAECEQQQ